MGKIMHGGISYSGGGGSGGASVMSDLTDVELTNLADGQVLKYNAANQNWVNNNESGGTTVIANPSGTPTDELETIQIGEDIFEIVGGGGGSYSTALLYANAGTSVGDITLSDDYTNYDQLYFECIRTADNRSYIVPYYMIANSLDTTGHFQLFGYNEYCSYDVTNSTTFTKVNNSGKWYIKNIYGIKY